MTSFVTYNKNRGKKQGCVKSTKSRTPLHKCEGTMGSWGALLRKFVGAGS